MKPSKDQIKFLREENRKYSRDVWTVMTRDRWPVTSPKLTVMNVWRNRDFLVVQYLEGGTFNRLTINRTDVDRDGEWKQDITWDELNRIKCGVGFGDHTAIEVFPPDKKIVNVANMRHLWIVPDYKPTMIPVWGVNL